MTTSTKAAPSKKSTPAKAKKATAKKPVKFVPPTVEEGTWQDTIVKSAVLKGKAEAGSTKATTMLWEGAVDGITDWLAGDAETDASGEQFYNTLVGLMGTARRGDAHKIKTVAVAAKDEGLVLSAWPSLTKAVAEAKRLTQTVKQDEADDNAADEAVTALADSAPKSTSKPEGAAQIILKEGVDEAARLLLDALNGPSGEQNTAAHRAFLRAVSQEIAGRQPKPEPKKASTAPKSGATKAKAGKPVAEQGGKAKPKPNAKVKRQTVAEAEAELAAEQESGVEPDDIDSILAEDVEDDKVADEVSEDVTPDVPVAKADRSAKPKGKAKPIVRRG